MTSPTPETDSPDRYARAAELLKALGHPLRLRIIAALAAGDAHVSALAARLGTRQPIVSQQLRILRMKGLVGVVRRDGFAVYRLAEPDLRRIVEWADGLPPG
jgi:ArsR family transcriptional regulator